MNRASSGHSRYPSEQRAALVREFRSSGETQKAFAGRHGIKWTTFRNWLYGRRAAVGNLGGPAGFQEIRIAPLGSPGRWGCEISLEGGTVVRFQAGTDPQWVGAILQRLRQPC